jgi:hypothetical protein
MLKRNTLLVASVGALVTVLVAASTDAFPTTRYNDLTFSQPVALPGVTLPAGKYRFEIANPHMNQDVVRVSDPRTSRVFLTAHTLRVPRPRGMAADQAVVFGESPAGQPPPIKVWYPLHAIDGREFRY